VLAAEAVYPPAIVSPAKSLTWIHLSDLHFGHGREATTRFDQKLVTDKIIDDAKLVAGELGAPDVVFLTGDIAFSASAEKEYAAAEEWLVRLLASLKIGRERVLLVPGNHDVDRKKALEGQGRVAHKVLRADPDEVNELLEKPADMEAIWPKLAAYQKFASNFGSSEISAARPFWTKRLSNDLGAVDVIGLNTALLSFDGTDSPKNLALGLGQIQQALKTVDRDALLIVLQHHPPEWLRDGKELRAMLKEWPHVLLSGHVHEQQGFITLPIASRGSIELVAGAGHQDVGDDGEHAYAWGRLTRDGLEYYPRAWHKKEMSFRPQQIHPQEDQKAHTFKLGEFARFPREKLPGALSSWLLKNAAYSAAVPTSDPIAGPAVFRAPPSGPVAADAIASVAVATFDPANAYFFVPYRAKGDQVIGRADALLKVREQLEKGRPTAIGQTVAFVGLGGLGKTQLAVEYAHEHKTRYPNGVYWFNADGDLDGQLTRLAFAARWASPASEPIATLEIAKHQIRTRSDCLIVFDNVESLANIEALLPESTATPHLLITSRVSQVGFDPVPIDRLVDEQSLELLRTESGRKMEERGDHEAALRIATQLEGLPLALELAGAYLRRFQNVTWTSYADLLEREGVRARGFGDGPLASFTKHNANLYATLHVEEAIFAGSPRLREALDLLAWSGSVSMGRTLLAFLLGEDDPAALDVALGEAETLRILKREQGAIELASSRFHMHRLVREVRRAEVPLEREPDRWGEVLARMGRWFEARRAQFSDRASYEAELDHLEVWQGHAARLGHMREAARLLWLRAYPYYNQGQFQRAHDVVHRALALFEQTRVVDSALEAHLRSDLGNTLGRLGQHRKALGCKQVALEIRLKVLGEVHADTATSLNNVGTTFGALGQRQTALEYKQRALGIRSKLFGGSSSQVADSLSHVGSAFSELGDYRKALDYQRRALSIRQGILEEKHPDMANLLGNIGFSFGMLKNHQEALAHKLKALEIQREVLGEKHPDTAGTHENVAVSLFELGKHSDAFAHINRALVIRREILGYEHPDTIKSWGVVVRILLQQHNKAEAMALVEADLRRFPHSSTLKQLKNEILRKPSVKASSAPFKKTKPPKR
jgi:tetratricopeptide (TPR) repeat protein/predicted MPP superfamily phosphohydrolase